jgi:glycosyltransferase involved in cell wall biosynthesis
VNAASAEPRQEPFRVLLLVPVYNHAQTLRAVVEGCLREGHEVLVMDDGSTDGSLDAVSDLPILRHRLPVNRGKGAAIRAGAALAAAKGYEAIITLDADGQHDPADANKLVEAAASAWPCIVLGERKQDATHRSSASLFGMAFSNFWVRLECGRTLPDTQSGYRLYPTALLTQRFFSRRYTFEIEVLVRGSWAGLPVLSTLVSVYYPPKDERVSHFRMFRDNLRLTALHTWLVLRSLVPWPYRRVFKSQSGDGAALNLFHPIRFFRQLSLEHTSPKDLAIAAGIGIFIGSLPIIPFGIVTILYVCHRFRLNKLAGAGASNICVMPFVPFLCIEAGHLLRYGEWWTTFTWKTLVQEIPLRAWEWLLGSFIVGPILGIVGALLTYSLVRSLRARIT